MSGCAWKATGNPEAHCVACGDPGAVWLALTPKGEPVEVADYSVPGVCGGPELALCKPCIHGLSIAMAAEHFAAEGLPPPKRRVVVETPVGVGTLEGEVPGWPLDGDTTGPGKR